MDLKKMMKIKNTWAWCTFNNNLRKSYISLLPGFNNATLPLEIVGPVKYP